MSYCLRWYSRSALVWFQCQSHQKWAGLPRTLETAWNKPSEHGTCGGQWTKMFLSLLKFICVNMPQNVWPSVSFFNCWRTLRVQGLNFFNLIENLNKIEKNQSGLKCIFSIFCFNIGFNPYWNGYWKCSIIIEIGDWKKSIIIDFLFNNYWFFQ